MERRRVETRGGFTATESSKEGESLAEKVETQKNLRGIGFSVCEKRSKIAKQMSRESVGTRELPL